LVQAWRHFPAARASLSKFQQPLIDQYVSKYTPDLGGLSTGERPPPFIRNQFLLSAPRRRSAGSAIFHLELSAVRGYNWAELLGEKGVDFPIYNGILLGGAHV
jgi:hypothetical protein